MAKGQRLIDANAVLDKIRNSTASQATKVTAFVFVDTAPTVEAVPVVRCKDCVYSQKHPHTKGMYFCDHPRFKWAVPRPSTCMGARDFCSCGERREANG